MAATFVVEDGTGLATANSFASVAEAAQYNDNYAASATWTALAQASKEKHLRFATQFIQANWNGRWKGYQNTSTQALAWPRSNVCVESFILPSNPLPQMLKDATCEAAFRSFAGDTLIPDMAAGASGTISGDRVKIGPLEFETDYGSSSSSSKVYTIINDMLRLLVLEGSLLGRG